MNTPTAEQIRRYVEDHRQHLSAALTVLLLMIVLVIVLRRIGRTHGLRRLTRRALLLLPTVGRDLAAPLTGRLRHHRAVRLIAGHVRVTDPATAAVDALILARGAVNEADGYWPYRVRIGDGRVDIGLAGPLVTPPPAGSPWQAVDPRIWRTPLPVPRQPAPARPRDSPLPVLVGVTGRDLILLDLARAPGVLSVHGSPAPVRRLVEAITGQLRSAPAAWLDRLLVVESGVDQLLSTLLQEPVNADMRTVLVCHHPTPPQAVRIAELSRRHPGLIVVVAGYFAGTRWRLPVTPAGRLVVPELGIDAYTEPVGPALVRAGRRGAVPVVPHPAVPQGPDHAARAAAATDDLIEPTAGTTSPEQERPTAVTARPGGR